MWQKWAPVQGSPAEAGKQVGVLWSGLGLNADSAVPLLCDLLSEPLFPCL